MHSTWHDQMLAVVKGETPSRLLFVPRLDIWYNRHKARGTLPPGFETLSLREVAHKLGVGFHSVVPDFIRTGKDDDIFHRALGFYNNPDFPYRADFGKVDFEVETSDAELKLTYHGVSGEITTRCRYGRELLESGVSIPDITEHAIKTPDDYIVLAEVLSRVEILPTPGNYAAHQRRVGADGLAVAYLSLACGPMQHIMRDLRKYEAFCLDLFDCPERLAVLNEVLAGLYERMMGAILQSAAEVVIFGANYDDTITYPPFFDEHIAPWLNWAAERLHPAGKSLLTHTDGENRGLLPSFANCRFDIADSISPAPMTKVTMREYREAFRGRTTIWGGIPSTITLPHSCPEADFRSFVQELIRDCRPYDRLILSIADTTPPDADFGRIRYLCEQCAG